MSFKCIFNHGTTTTSKHPSIRSILTNYSQQVFHEIDPKIKKIILFRPTHVYEQASSNSKNLGNIQGDIYIYAKSVNRFYKLCNNNGYILLH
jgi:hypothetical protein